MASSVARMPATEEWHPFSSHHHRPRPFPAKNLRKVLVRERPSSSSSSHSSNACIPTTTTTTTDAADPPSSPATAARRRQSQILDRWAAHQAREMITTIERQAHQAEISALSSTSQPVSARAASFLRETSPSLSDSSSTTTTTTTTSTNPPPTVHPPTAPPPPPPTATNIELPSNVRASSLIQMWRELEAEAGLATTPRAGTNCTNSTVTNAPASPSSAGEPSGSYDSEPFVDWDSDAVSSSVADSERGRVENIVKMLSAAKAAQGFSVSSWSDENENSGIDHRDCLASPRANGMRVRGRREIEELMVRLEQERRRELEKLMERQAVSRFSHRGRIQSLLKFMFLRRESAAQYQPKTAIRTSELDQLQKGAAICSLRQRFNHRGPSEGSREPAVACSSRSVQFLDSSRDSGSNGTVDPFTKQTINHRGQHRSSEPAVDYSRSLQVQFIDNTRDSGYTCASDKSIRQDFNHGGKHAGSEETTSEGPSSFCNSQDSGYICTSDEFNRQNIHHVKKPSLERFSNLHIELCDNTQDSSYICTTTRLTGDTSQLEEVALPSDPECTLREANSPPPRSEDLSSPPLISEDLNSPPLISEDLQEGNRSIDGSWDERNLWVSNLDWQRPLDSSTPISWQGEIVTEELEPYSHQDVRNNDDTWISDSSNSWRTWDISRHTTYHDFLENFSDNVEIRELLERRRVTTSLASGFREKMNRLIISFLQRQGQYDIDGNVAEEDEDRFVWRPNHGFLNPDQVASTSSSLVPLPYKKMYHQENWQDASFGQNSSPQLLEVEVAHDLRTDVAQIHHEISELRKLVESCMDWQRNMQNSIKQEVSGAICQSARIGDTSNWRPLRKGSCCICCEMPVDSLLYRCGHMCTCFKCAHELQWSSGRCPICRAPIVDVVRAYSNS